MSTRACTRCGEIKPRDEFSPYRRAEPEKLMYWCKACNRQRRKKWSAENPVNAKEQNDRWLRENREKNKARCRKWRTENPEKHKEHAARSLASYHANADEWNARNRAWVEANPERKREQRRRNNALRSGAKRSGGQKAEHVEPLVVLERWDGVCGICGLDVNPFDFQLDHHIPLSRGGIHAAWNVRPSHPSCNRKKGARFPWALS